MLLRSHFVGAMVILVAVAVVPGSSRAQAPKGKPPSAGFLEGVTIQGFYLNFGPVQGQSKYLHQVKASGTPIDLDLSLYPGLQEWLDSGHLKNGAPINVRGALRLVGNQEAPGGTCKIVCQVIDFKPVQLPEEVQATQGAAVQPERGVDNRAGNTGGVETGSAKVPAARPTPDDVARAGQVNRSGGMAIRFDGADLGRNQQILGTLEQAGLRIVNADPSLGLIFADVAEGRSVNADLIANLKSIPTIKSVSSRPGSQRAPTVQIPHGERPTLIERGRPTTPGGIASPPN